MFLKKTTQKNKQRRPSCAFFLCICTDHNPATHAGHTKAPPATASGNTKRRASCFSWYWMRRKKSSPEPPIAIAISVPAYEGRIANGTEENIKHRRSRPREPASVSGDAITELQQSLLPSLSHKFDVRSRTETALNTAVVTLNRGKHAHMELDRPAATTFQVKSPTRATPRGEKPGPKAGLTVLGLTIAITVFCGRAAAVVSLCACLYLMAFLRQPDLAKKTAEKMAAAGGGVDLGSKEHKKRVVMEGFLERGRRKPLRTVSALER